MNVRNLVIALELSRACVGCEGRARAPGAVVNDAVAPVFDAPQAIPANFLLSTNEPWWKVRIENGVVLLTGPHGQRRLTVQRNEAVFDGRAVTAQDDSGTLERRVTERLCLDSVSGKQSAYSGRLVIDGGAAVIGCGEPLPETAAE